MAFDDPTKGGDWVEDTPSTSPRKSTAKKPAPISLGADWVEDTSGPPATVQVLPSQPGVEINLSDFSRAKNLLPSQQEVGRRVHQSLGFTDEEAQKYVGESGKSFYEGNPADLLKISETDPATLGRVVLPELSPGAIQEKRDWLSNHRSQKAAQEAEMRRQATAVALSGAFHFPIPQFASEAISDISAGALGSVGAATKGAGTLAEKLRRGFGYQDQNSALTRWGGEVEDASKTLALGGAPEGSVRKTLQYGAGAIIPALALRHPEAIGGLSALEAKGEGKGDWEAVKSGLISAAMVGAMGKAAQGVGKIEGLQNIVGESMADRAQKVLGRFSGRAAANIGIGEGGLVAQGQFDNPLAQAQNLAFGMGFAMLPHPSPEMEAKAPKTIPTLSDRLALPPGPEPITRQTAAGYDYSPYPAQYPEANSRTFSSSEGQRSTVIGQEGIPPTYEMEPGGPQAYTIKEQDQLASSRRKVAEIPMPKVGSPAYAKQSEQSFVRGEQVPREQDYTRGAGFMVEDPNAPPRFTSTKSGDFLPQSGGVASRVESGNQNVPPVLSRMTSGLFGTREQRVGSEASFPILDNTGAPSPIQSPSQGRELSKAETKAANGRRLEGMIEVRPEDIGVPKGGGEFPPEQKFGGETSIPNRELNESGIPTITPKLPAAGELGNFKSPTVKDAASKLGKPGLGARIAEGLAGTKGRGTQELPKDPEEMSLQELQDVVKRPQDYSRRAFEDASTEWKYRQFKGQEGFLRLGGGEAKSSFEKEMEEKYGEKWFRKMNPDEALRYRDTLSLKDKILNSPLIKDEGGFIRFGKGKEHPFYSPAEEVVDEKMPRKMPAKDLNNWLKKQGISDEELEWTGLGRMLEEKGTNPVTKQEALEQLVKNRVKVEVTEKGKERTLSNEEQAHWAELNARHERLYELQVKQEKRLNELRYGTTGEHKSRSPEEEAEFRRLADEHSATLKDYWEVEDQRRRILAKGNTQYDSYQTPGAKEGTYHEMLLTLPEKDSDPTGPRGWLNNNANAAEGDSNYRSPHWNEPNVLAHLRFHERTDAEGKRVMFLDEMQSDMHKEGSEGGYKTPLSQQRALELSARQAEIKPDVTEVLKRNGYFGYDSARQAYLDMLRHPDFAERWEVSVNDAAILKESFDIHNELTNAYSDKPPNAPFKGRAWKTLALRHAIRYAAENGFDRIAWTTGDMQADRYDLSKLINRLEYERAPDGTYSITGQKNAEAAGGRNQTMVQKSSITAEELPAVVGRELADKILQSKDPTGGFEGLDLKIGGEGKRNLYDKEIPNLANEIGKKFGVKVGKTTIGAENVAGELIPDGAGGLVRSGLPGVPPRQYEVHSFDIPSSMREAVLEKGQPIMGKAPSFIKDESGKINLNLLGVPQAAKVIQAGQDLLKRIPDLTSVKGAKEVWSNLKWLVGSDSMLDPKTKLVAREWMGWRALDDSRAYQAVKDLNNHFTSGIQLDPKSYTPEVQSRLKNGTINPKQAYFIDFEDRIQRGIPQANPQLQGFADTVKTLFNERLDTIKNEKLGGKEILDAYYNNYFPQLFKNGAKAQTFVQEFLSRTPLAGNAGGAFKAKKYPTILDGLDAGLELKFQNPAESVLTRIGQLDHFIMGHRIGEEVKNNPQLGGKWLPPTAQLPEGYSWVNDKIFTQFAEPNRRGGISIAKRFAAPTPIAAVIDRVVAPSFFSHSAARGLRDINNLMLSVKLGLSSFHGFFAAQDAPAFKLAQVLEKLSKQNYAGAIQSLKELPAAPVTLFTKGALLAKEALNPGSTGSAQHAQMVDWLTAGGARFNQTADYSSNFADKLGQGMREAVGSFKNGEYLDALTKAPGIAVRSPLALIEQVGKPIMKYEVPNIKLGVKAQLMQTEMDRLGTGATREQIREASARVNDVVDDALGQLAYDNLFWHPALKGLTQLGVQSLGWNIGTIRSVGGGIADLGKQPIRMGAKGLEKMMGAKTPISISKVAAQPIELTHHAAYVMGMIMMTGLTNTIIQGVLTKINKGVAEAPRDWKDLFIPRTGRVDDQGREERVTNPSYVKDILHFSTEPLATIGNKASPLLRTFYEQLRNADWRHVEIVPNGQEYNPLSGDFWKGRSSHFLQQFTPISVNNLLKERAANDEEQKFPWPPFPTSKEEALPFLGVTKAPAALTDTPAELFISHTLAGQKAQRPMTEGEFERSALKNRISKGLREGTDKASDQLTRGLDEGIINTKDLSFVFGNALTHTKLERNFGALERFEDAVKAYNIADEKEKELIRPILIKKYVGESEKWAASPAKTKELDGLAQQAGLR